MLTSDFEFELPPELIAQEPAPERAASRLMILDRSRESIEHAHFSDLASRLRPGDVLTLNDTRVLAARLFARSGRMLSKEVEILLLEPAGVRRWSCLAGPGRNARVGDRIVFRSKEFQATVVETTDFGGRILEFDPGCDVEELMRRHGQMPLPPYIHRAEGEAIEGDGERYQTVFAKHPGAVAAPTAALHFSRALLDELSSRGVEIRVITLHVGIGTFRPVKTAKIEDHVMHRERYCVGPETAEALGRARAEKRRIVAVGTTVVRAIESFFTGRGLEPGRWHETRLFVAPGYAFRMIDAVITNFHLPRSTLLMLVSAFAGREFLLRAYREAVGRHYRFFSYGDAMLIE